MTGAAVALAFTVALLVLAVVAAFAIRAGLFALTSSLPL